MAAGTACQREFSMAAKPQRASSWGAGRALRISSVCQLSAISRPRRSSSSSRSPAAAGSWRCSSAARCSKSAAMASYF